MLTHYTERETTLSILHPEICLNDAAPSYSHHIHQPVGPSRAGVEKEAGRAGVGQEVIL